MGHGACTSIVRMLAVNSIHLLVRFRAKIVSAFMGLPTRNSAARRMISQQHSGGLEVICEEHKNPLGHGPMSFIVVVIFLYWKGKPVDDAKKGKLH